MPVTVSVLVLHLYPISSLSSPSSLPAAPDGEHRGAAFKIRYSAGGSFSSSIPVRPVVGLRPLEEKSQHTTARSSAVELHPAKRRCRMATAPALGRHDSTRQEGLAGRQLSYPCIWNGLALASHETSSKGHASLHCAWFSSQCMCDQAAKGAGT